MNPTATKSGNGWDISWPPEEENPSLDKEFQRKGKSVRRKTEIEFRLEQETAASQETGEQIELNLFRFGDNPGGK